jgi:hypothetical protein
MVCEVGMLSADYQGHSPHQHNGDSKESHDVLCPVMAPPKERVSGTLAVNCMAKVHELCVCVCVCVCCHAKNGSVPMQLYSHSEQRDTRARLLT